MTIDEWRKYYYGNDSDEVTPSYASSYFGSGFKKTWSDYYGGNYYDKFKSTLGTYESKLTSSYSGSSFADSTELMIKAYKETRDMVVILDFPFDVNVIFSNYNTSSFRDSKFIFLETGILENNNYTSGDKINIICGLGVHEACHLKYTSYSVYSEFLKKLENTPEAVSSDVRKSNIGFIKTIIHLIEDMRVESLLLMERPGYSDLLKEAKDYKFSKYSFKINRSTSEKKELTEFLDALFKHIRYPDKVDQRVIDKNKECFERIQEIISPPPKTTKDSCIISVKIFNEVIKEFKKVEGFKESDIDNLLNSINTGIGNSEDIYYGSDGGLPMSSVIGAASCTGKISPSLSGSKIASKVISGEFFKGTNKNTYFIKEDGNKNTYKRELDKVSSLIPAMRKIIFGIDKNYDFNITGCRSGLLDTNKLAEAYQGVPQVYIRKGEVRTNKVALCVLVDESGSMGCEHRCVLARQAAILLNEALKNMSGVDLYIYGHSADQNYSGSTELYVYREGKTYCPEAALSCINARYENRDGTAINEVVSRVRKFTSERGILIVLSDGSPAARDYWGSSAERDVRTNVDNAERQGFDVIQVSIGTVNNVDYMFPKNIDLHNDISKLPLELSKIVRKSLQVNKKTTIN